MTQFLCDTQGSPLFAVISYQDFKKVSHLLTETQNTPHQPSVQPPQHLNLLSKNRFITLPHGGGSNLDISSLIDYFLDRNIVRMAINQRAQSFDVYPHTQLNTLDPLIRWNCLRNTPYFNTMQAVNVFIDALVSTGVFKRTTHFFPNVFSRSVKSVEIVETEAKAFLAKNPVQKKWLSPTLSA